MNKVSILDHGYVRLVDSLGSDLTIVNSARVSYDKEVNEMSQKDINLIHYLGSHGHTSPFRHAILQFEVYAPLMIARQWWKYVVGSDHTMDAWNESSRRYVTEEPQFYVPDAEEWRSKPVNSKQGSAEPIHSLEGQKFTDALNHLIIAGKHFYDAALLADISAEQARLFLPAYSMYVRWYWTASLQSVIHLINQRTKNDAQAEFQEYAKAVHQITYENFPVSIDALTKQYKEVTA